jgi:PadR family transcriptional regulator PadR
MCVLAIVGRRDCYGFSLIKQITQKLQIAAGTVYPLLKRLKEQGYINYYLEESIIGPPRKYYTITDSGRHVKQELERQWTEFAEGVNSILKEEDNHE